MSSIVGLVLSERFQVQQKIGEEMLGSVFLALDQQTGDTVHVKVLHPHFAANEEKFARFGREITATEMVKHPNTVKVVGWGQHLEMRYLVLEAVAAHGLDVDLEKGPMPPERAAHIAAQIAAAVGAAHQEGIVHRNLSPHNVLLLDNAANGDFVKVRDFGLSKLDSDDADDSNGQLTQVGARVGNTHYMAPEYVEEGKVHPKGDVYAVGALLFHMLTGRPPYEGRAGDVLTAHVASPVPVPSQVRPDLPPWCDAIVARLMAKKTKERPGAYRVPQLLEEAVGSPLAAPKLLKPGAPPPTKRKPPVMAAGVVGAAMMAAAAVVVLGGVVLLGGVVVYQATQTVASVDEPIDREGGLAPVEAPPEAALPAAAPSPEAQPAPAAAPSPRAAPRPTPRPAPAPAPAAPAGEVGSVEVRANERALVYVNGKVKGYTPLTVKLAPGEHDIAVALPGQAQSRQEKRVSIGAKQTDSIDFSF